jgi:PAS domain S-box-containing protein
MTPVSLRKTPTVRQPGPSRPQGHAVCCALDGGAPFKEALRAGQRPSGAAGQDTTGIGGNGVSQASGPLQLEIERRARAEQALRATEEQFHHLLADVQGYAIFLLDPQGHVVSWNAGAERIKGYRPEDILGQHFSRFYTPEDAKQGAPERGLQLAKERGRFEAEGWRVRKDGSRFWANVVITPLPDERGKLRGFLKITRDLTEQRRAEERLREANAELERRVRERTEEPTRANDVLRAEVAQHAQAGATLRRQAGLLEQTYDPIIVWEFPGLIVYWNRAAEQLYGFTKQEAVGRVSHDLLRTVFPEGQPALEAALERAGAWAGELTHTKKGGERVTVETRMRLIAEAGGKRLVLDVNRDVSERKRAEEEIRRLNANLERLVRERTAQLEEVVQSLQAFSYSVSHDLRAPLRNVQTLAQAMLEDYGDCLDETGRDYAQRLVTSARRMDTLIRDLLSYSRLTRAEVSPQRVSLASAVSEALRELDPDLAQPGADVTVAEPLPAVRAHRTTLVQVVKNLLTNAVKFVEPGVRPRVRVWAEDRGDRVRLWVEDNGIGIAAEHHTRVFGVFERLHGEESYPGTGIDLAIVHKGVERMGGQCGVESEVDRGSRFWIELPKAEGAA